MTIFKVICWFLIENIWCRVNGHHFVLTKDIKINNINVPFDGVQILTCKHCKKTKMMWYINTND